MSKHMLTRAVVLLVCMPAGLTACSDNDAAPQATNNGVVLGPQIERMGRAAINTAVTDPFFRETVPAELARHNDNVNAYDADDDVRGATGRFAPQFRDVLAIFDGVDQVCGNQLLAGDTAAEHRNGTLALVLANDELYLNTDSGVCEQYLGVELDFVGASNNDCGGRTPLHDTIDVSFSALVTGQTFGVDDGLPADGDGAHSNSIFPFLDPPFDDRR